MPGDNLSERIDFAFRHYPGRQRGLARRIAQRENVTEQAVGRWRRTGKVQRDHLVGLAAELGISIEWLLTGRGEMSNRLQVETRVPVVGSTAGGVDPELVGRRAGPGEDVVMVPSSFGPCFAVRVAGSPELWPRYNEGEVVIVAAESEPTVGFDVFVQRPGWHENEATLYRLAWRMGQEIALDPVTTRQPERRVIVHLDDAVLCRPVLSTVPPTQVHTFSELSYRVGVR